MALATGKDATEACWAHQLCAGSKAGIEAAVHAMHDIFDQEDTEAVLLVDAAKAFNKSATTALELSRSVPAVLYLFVQLLSWFSRYHSQGSERWSLSAV